jgi:hypothetical protein
VDSHQHRRMLFAREQKWIAEYVPTPPQLRAVDLIRGTRYAVVMHHNEGCWIHAGWRCTCRPHTRFFAEPVTQN